MAEVRSRVVAGLLAAGLVAVLVAVRLSSEGEIQATRTPAASAGSAPGATVVVHPTDPRGDELPDQVLGGIRFVDVTEQIGLAGRGAAVAAPTAADMDAGAAVADLDGDDDLDLVLTSSGRSSGLFRNDGHRFVDMTARSGITDLATATTPAFADIDADGDLDLFLGGRGTELGRLLLNDGAGWFTDRSLTRGIVARPGSRERAIRGADFGDIDRDGDLDLLVTDWNIGSFVAVGAARSDSSERVTNQCQYATMARRLHVAGVLAATGETRLFRNDDGHFVDRTRQWGLAGLGIERPFTPQFADLDGDGWEDLAVAGDSCSSRLYRNDRGRRFVDVTARARVGTDENGMGSLLRDLDGDGRLDWLVTSIAYPTADGRCPHVSLFAGCSGNRVYLNRGGMRFEEATDELGLRHSGWAWGVAAADFGNDGRLQVAVTNGRIGPREVDAEQQADVYYDTFDHDPTSFFAQDRDGLYVDVAAQVGISDDAVGHALVVFDQDQDGRLDLLVAHAGAAPNLYRNVTRPRGRWLAVRLRDASTPGNSAGVGARVEITRTDGTTVTQWVHRSGSYESQQPAEVHVGLASSSTRRVRVWWPGDEEPQVLTTRLTGLVTIDRAR